MARGPEKQSEKYERGNRHRLNRVRDRRYTYPDTFHWQCTNISLSLLFRFDCLFLKGLLGLVESILQLLTYFAQSQDKFCCSGCCCCSCSIEHFFQRPKKIESEFCWAAAALPQLLPHHLRLCKQLNNAAKQTTNTNNNN